MKKYSLISSFNNRLLSDVPEFLEGDYGAPKLKTAGGNFYYKVANLGDNYTRFSDDIRVKYSVEISRYVSLIMFYVPSIKQEDLVFSEREDSLKLMAMVGKVNNSMSDLTVEKLKHLLESHNFSFSNLFSSVSHMYDSPEAFVNSVSSLEICLTKEGIKDVTVHVGVV